MPPCVSCAGAQGEGSPVVYRGPIAQMPEEHASRRERFAELDGLQSGWQVKAAQACSQARMSLSAYEVFPDL